MNTLKILVVMFYFYLNNYIQSQTPNTLRVFNEQRSFNNWKFYDIVGSSDSTIAERLAVSPIGEICLLRDLPQSIKCLKHLYASIAEKSNKKSNLDLCREFVSFLRPAGSPTLEVYPTLANKDLISKQIRSTLDSEKVDPSVIERTEMANSAFLNKSKILSNESLVLVGTLEENRVMLYYLYLSKNGKELINIVIEEIDKLEEIEN